MTVTRIGRLAPTSEMFAAVVLLAIMRLADGQQRPDAIGAQSQGNLDFLDAFRAQPPGSVNAQGQSFRITGRNLADVDWRKIDRRAEEGWWHLYPFGERFYDQDISSRPWNDKQIDLDFFFPYYGFRFNYSFIFPEGFVAFSYPWYIQPPYTFPNNGWPSTPDPSLIAAFMTDQTIMSVGETRISHVWYRVISRPPNLIGTNAETRRADERRPNSFGTASSFDAAGAPLRYYNGQLLRTQPGRIEDPDYLDLLTRDIRRGMVGARGFTADYAIVVTWERMAYGGAPKSTNLHLYEQVKRGQNTYQLVLASDEIRSYSMFNYANINWTSSTSAGALFGRGGKQSAIVGFNGGNGTGFVQLPYSAEGNSYKLVQFGSTQTAGRWLARTDEAIVYGGCTNTSTGILRSHTRYGTMLGGFALNVSGPCLRPTHVIKLQLDELTLDCERIDMVVGRCVVPVNSIFRTGLVDMKLSVDGGKNYPFWNTFYIIQPAKARQRVQLLNDPVNTANNWRSPWSRNLTLTWSAANISTDANAQVDITLWGYWEDVEGHSFVEVASIVRNTPNRGAYSFDPQLLSRQDLLWDAWRKYYGGVIQVRTSDNWMADRGDGLYWSKPIPFGWYMRPMWEKNHGKDWALQICQQWFQYDGRRTNMQMELEMRISCPCTLDQALSDFGRFTPKHDCDMTGNAGCYYTQGAKHCVISTSAVWTGAGQDCCYDQHGWLMFSDDYEYNAQYLRWYSAGVPFRAHPWGSFPYKRPPYVPTLSHFYNDLLPYDYCCKWAGHCEFFFWRRQSSACQAYQAPTVGFAYGEPHFITYDGVKYTFNGKGYYILSMMKSPRHDLMVQVRMEQPVKTLWDTAVRATVITGVAARDNGSSTVQLFARKDFRRWRYRMDVYVDGIRVYFDRPHKKLQTFNGVVLRNPSRNMNTSEIDVMFATGVGVKVSEARGLLNVIVSLPPIYNETHARRGGYGERVQSVGKCADLERTLGLLGTFNGDARDDLTSPECTELSTSQPPTPNDLQSIYHGFGEKWRVDGAQHRVLFQTTRHPLYDPAAFASKHFEPVFDPWQTSNSSFWESLIFSRDQVRVACHGVASCEFDYIMTGRREIALDTLSTEQKFDGMKKRGERRHVSCGNLQKNRGVIKYPVGNSYLDGVTVTFNCKPEFFLHGTEQRTCVNGSWTPGWWVWCRERNVEIALKWLVGMFVAIIVVAAVAAVFACFCYTGMTRREKNGSRQRRAPRNAMAFAEPKSKANGLHAAPMKAKPPPVAYDVPVMEREPTKPTGSLHGSRTAFAESSA